jgi:TolA-binding protein
VIEVDKYTEALPFLQKLTDLNGDRSIASKAWMKTGFVNQQLNETNRAIDAYKHVVTDYPASEERLPALEALKNLYIQLNQPSAYVQMLRDNKLPSADSTSLDSTYYAAAETQFAAGKWEVAKQAFTDYLKQFTNGVFAIKAHYYRAECNYQLKLYKEAREDYNITLSGPWNDFVENSAKRAATIAYEEKNYAAAYDFYKKLIDITTDVQTKELAYDGLMKSGYNSGKFAESGTFADTLLSFPGASVESINNALYYKAKTMQRLDSNDAAIRLYKQLSGNKNGDIAAESRYHIAEILFKQNKLKEAETAANESIKQNSGYAEWVGKSCILLTDILVKQDDYFNAKAFLESIVKHTKNADLKKEAAKKLEDVKKLEKRHSKLSGE